MAGSIERELKVEVDSSFHVPDLTALIGVSVVSLPEVTLEATYYDTAELALARWGATLRHRVSSAGSQSWTLKLPAALVGRGETTAAALERDEIDFEGRQDKIPADAVALLRTYVRDAPLAPVAVLETRRRRNLVMSATDTLAEMDDDIVDFRSTDGRTGSFRELEIELAETGPVGILRRIHDVLVSAGVADAEAQPKLFRALGGTPDPAVAPLPADHTPASVGELVGLVVSGGTLALLGDDPRVRLGDDPAVLARWWRALERLIVQLEDVGRHLDRDWHDTVASGLDELASHVDGLANLDELVGRLTAGASRLLPEDQSAAAELVEILSSQRKAHQVPLADYLDSPDYLELTNQLVVGARSLPLRRARSRTPAEVMRRAVRRRLDILDARAHDAAREGFHPAVRARSASAGDGVPVGGGAAAGGGVPDGRGGPPAAPALSRAARAALATAELGVLTDGRAARRLRDDLSDLDAWLGELDAAVAAQRWLRECGPDLDGRLALAAGQLLAGETRRANRARRHWGPAWKSVRDRGAKWPGT